MNKRIHMKKHAVKIGIIASILPHIFCCGIPLGLALLGLVAPNAAHTHIIPHCLEPWLFLFSGLMLLFSWYLVLRKCKCGCDNCDAPHNHRVQKIILSVISIIFIISIILHLMTHHH